MKSCESYEIDLSSLLDGELSPAAAAGALEHTLGCPECAEFFRAARRVQGAAETLRADDGALSEARAEALWHAVETRSAGERSRPMRPARALRAAALVALGLGGGYLLAGLAGSGSLAAGVAGTRGGTPSDTRLASVSGSTAMDERRFVALADELLKSDARYQRAMLEVLRLVPALETGEGLRTEDEPRIVRASNEDDRREAGEI